MIVCSERNRASRRPKVVPDAVLRVSASAAQSTANFCVVPLRWPDGLRRVSTDGSASPVMYSFVPGRSFSKKSCHTNGVDNGRQVSPSSPRASHRSDCTGPVSILLPATPIARVLPVSAVKHTFCVTPYATRTRIGTQCWYDSRSKLRPSFT